MAGVVTPQDVADLVASILPDLDRMNWEQIAQDLTDYEVMRYWLRDDKVTFSDGIAIRKNLLSQLSGAASHTGLTDVDDVDIPDLMDDMTVSWVHAQTKWGYNYQTDILMNSGKSRINDTVKPRRIAAMIDLAQELEAKAWQVPAWGDKLNPYGLPYWIVFNATLGFSGGYPTGPDAVAHPTIAGVNLTESPKFKNYSAQYAAVSKGDLLPKMRTALRKTNFKSPVGKEDMGSKRAMDRRYYCDEVTCSAFEEVGEASNENLGRDLAPYEAGNGKGHGGVTEMDGTLVFKKHPIIYIPQLDDTAVFTAATNPIYQVDHNTFYPVSLKGDYLRETGPQMSPTQHNMWRTFIDLTYNFICVNRRKNAVFAK